MVRKTVLYLPADLAKALKVRAAEEETSMSAFVAALIEEALARKGGKSVKK
ncbi:MAG TPA: ribbon-helix-helix protein, CopG family [Candidatus Binatia bacterium]|nr:ribbon-helix-helix protein, CopG family [Candidatus Binatia bacterium]